MPKSTTRKRRSRSNSVFKYLKNNSVVKDKSVDIGKIPSVVGEGTYGCVVSPSLHCEDGNHPSTYNHTVTKIMDRGDAADEYDELSKIASIDGIYRYVLKLPHKCVPDFSRRFDKTVRKCKGKRITRNFETPYRYKLLIMEDGGADLYNIIKTVLPKMDFPDICRFMTAIRELIEGLVFFRNNDIIHHDIKQENIVYNVETGLIKYIDFGLMMWRKDFINRSNNDSNSQGISWFNFPTESNCANKTAFHSKVCEKYKNVMTYDAFVKKSADTFDTFSLVLVMYDIMKALNGVPEFKKNVNFANFSVDMTNILVPFYDDIRARPTNIHKLHVDYDALLRKYKLVNETKPTPKQATISAYTSATKSFIKSKGSSTRKSPIGGKMCPLGKIINPNNGTCVKRCRPNQTRDGRFRCTTMKRHSV